MGRCLSLAVVHISYLGVKNYVLLAISLRHLTWSTPVNMCLLNTTGPAFALHPEAMEVSSLERKQSLYSCLVASSEKQTKQNGLLKIATFLAASGLIQA